MTERRIDTVLAKIESCKKNGFAMEALIRTYLLNADLLRFILSVSAPEQELGDKKIKVLGKIFSKESASHPALRTIIQKKSLKSVDSWLSRMDGYFKALKFGKHVSPGALQTESEKIFSLLRMSATKMLENSKSR